MRLDADITIIGAGIVGLATAYSLMQKHLGSRIIVIDKESKAGKHQSGHNSGVIHSGIYYTPGSLKAINCKKGYEMLVKFCDKYAINYDLCGKIIVATKKDQLPILKQIYQRGLANGLKGIKRLNKKETLDLEPNVSCLKSIHVPQTGIIDYLDVVKKLEELLINQGVKFLYNCKVVGLKSSHDKVLIMHNNGSLGTKQLITCAGLYADKLAAMTVDQLKVKIIPFRGEYYSLRAEKTDMIKNLIYPVPNPSFPFLGVHYTRKCKGGIEAGPNAVLAFSREGYSRWDLNIKELFEILMFPGFWILVSKYWCIGFGEMFRSFSSNAFAKAIKDLVKDIGKTDLIRSSSGVRAQALTSNGVLVDDYLIKQTNNIIHIINAPSPAATSCLAIGDYIANLIKNKD